MESSVYLIKGLAQRLKKNLIQNSPKSEKLGKVDKKLLNKIRDNFTDIFTEKDDVVFQKGFAELILCKWTSPYITANFFIYDSYNNYMACPSCCNFTNCFRFEIRWLVASLKYYNNVISDFVSFRKEYDNCVLLNRYEDALRIVEHVDKKFGVSIWSGESKFFLYTKLGKDTKALLASMPQTVVGAIFDFYELKNRNDITSDDYFYIVNEEINHINRKINKKSSAIEFFKYAILSIEYNMTDEGMMLLLDIIRYVSLIDQYLFFLRICEYALHKAERDEIYLYIKTYIQELFAIKDDHLTAVRFLFDSKENRKDKYTIKDGLEKAKEEFIKGNLLNSKKLALELLRTSPNNVEAINLLVDINVLSGNKFIDFSETNLGSLIQELQSIYTFKSEKENDLKELRKLLICTSFSTWSEGISNCIMYRCGKYIDSIDNKIEVLINLQFLDIETIIAGLPPEESMEYIKQKLDINNQYIKFRIACCQRKFDVAVELCNVKQINDLVFVHNDKYDIHEKMDHLGRIDGNDATIAVMRIKYFIAVSDLEENGEEVLRVSTELVVKNILASFLIPLEKIVDYIENADSNIRKSIYSPILYYVYSYYHDIEKKDDLGIVCEDFFYYNNIKSPKQMPIYSEKYNKETLIFFLKNVCTTKIMDLSVTNFANSQERDQERVEICNILCQIDSHNEKEYEKEIRELTRKLMISKEHRSIEENKIHVNIDGIKEDLIVKYKSDFSRYKFSRYKLVTQWSDDNKKLVFRDEPEEILKNLVCYVRDAFVSSNEYGLDGYLSLNIRHGTLADELRSTIYKSMLNAKRDDETGEYIINSYWIEKVSDSTLIIITKAIAEFYSETEAIISKLKEKYIQIRTEKKDTSGIFDYRLDKIGINYIKRMSYNLVDFGEFIDFIITLLWGITEENLRHIKEIINTEIIEDYNNAFNILKGKIVEVKDKAILRELTQKINEAYTDMPNVLNKICHWFQRSAESRHNDFDLQFAFDLGLETIKNMHPEKNFIAKAIEKTESDKISGGFLKNYDGIFYNLFNNVYKNAYSKDGKTVEIRYILKNQEGRQCIYLENDYDCTKDMTLELKKVERAKYLLKSGEYINHVRDEGGTGIPKICKIISVDMRCNAKIFFDYDIKENKFFIKLIF